jgi:hypothetical protein
MVSFNYRNRPARFQNPFQACQRFPRRPQMLQYETDKNMVENSRLKGKIKDVGLLELHISTPRGFQLLPGLLKGRGRNVNGGKPGLRILAGKGQGLGPNAAAGL